MLSAGWDLGRRRRRVIRVVKRTLPKVYSCPRCGVVAVRVSGEEGKVACASCGLTYTFSVTPKRDRIDIYNEFVDMFMAGKVGV